MRCVRTLGCSVFVVGCTMNNPAFEGDELADDATVGESTRGESETDEGESADSIATETTTESTTEDTEGETTTTDESETDDTSESETGNPCAEDLDLCDGVCVDLKSDPLNCLGCGTQCADNELCVGGCEPKKYVFVTSEPLNGAMGGILGADDFCIELAFQAGLPGDYLAWNSTALSYPDFDFVQEGVYVRTDEQIVANSYVDLTDGNIQHPISLDENGVATAVMGVAGCPNVTSPVWSNTTPFGEFAGGQACSAWTLNSNLLTATIGSALATDATWSQIADCNVGCGNHLPIYCVQQNP
jgi:hypothetical protein